jgi:phage terminase large subunit
MTDPKQFFRDQKLYSGSRARMEMPFEEPKINVSNGYKVSAEKNNQHLSLEAAIHLWYDDPIQFVRDNFGVEPDAWQKDALRDYMTKQCLAMKACKGPGKTTVLSWIGWHYLVTRPIPKIAAISISKDNLRDGLWTEMAQWQGESAFLQREFKWTAKRIYHKDYKSHWYMSARSFSKTADKKEQASALAGLHADYMMFLIDECSDIPMGVLATAEAGLTSGTECKIVMAGNPTRMEGPLYFACTQGREQWHIIEISSDPADPKRTPRVDIKWAQRMINQYGKDHPYVLINIMGKFPPSSLNVLLGPEEVKAAMKRRVKESDYKYAQKRIGVDVARFGDDRTIMYPRQGLRLFNPVEMRNADSVTVADRLEMGKFKFKSEREFVDDTGGFGAGVIDTMIRRGHDSTRGIHSSSKPTSPQFFNKRAEMHWRGAEWIKRGGSMPEDPELLKELTTPFYFFKDGKIIIESKDDIKARLGFSPDKGDAFYLTFAEPEANTMADDEFGFMNRIMDQKNGGVKDYNPFADLDKK